MKKALTLVLLSVIIGITAHLYVNAEERMASAERELFDAVEIDEDLKSSLAVKSNETVIRVLNTPVVFAFNNYSNLDEVLKGEDIDQVLYAIVGEAGVSSVYLIDEKGVATQTENSMLPNDYKMILALLQGEALKYLPGGTVVSNIYYFWGQSNHQGSALYYCTNEGEYVYYSGSIGNDNRYLFPANDFFEFMKAVYSNMGPENPPGGVDIESVWDLSGYNVASDLFSLKISDGIEKAEDKLYAVPFWGIIAFSAAAVAAGVTIGILFIAKKRKSRNKRQT